jgi:hypothetical protein
MIDGPIRFSEFLIQGNFNYVYGVTAVDVDRDGALDLIAADIGRQGDQRICEVYWYRNDGAGNFNRQTIWNGEPGWLERQAAADFTGNGFPDIVFVNNLLGKVILLENDGKPGAGLWKRHLITSQAPQAYDVAILDIDGDGQLDVAISGWRSNHISWYRNPGRANWGQEWQRFIIDSNMPEARTMCAADFKGNGSPGLLCTSTSRYGKPADATPEEHGCSIVWYEKPNDPLTQPWTKHVIDNESRGPCHGQPADIDGDGKLDFVMAIGMREELAPHSLHEVAWYENLGDGRKWKKHHVGKLPFALEAIAADIDNDGELEIVATAWAQGDRVVWFKRQGDPRGPWKMHGIKDPWRAANQIIAADLTGNGRLDLIATSDDGSKLTDGALELRWWRNDGPTNPLPRAAGRNRVTA